MPKSENRWTQAAYRSKILKLENTVVTEAWATIEELDVTFKFEDNAIQLDCESIEQEWKPTWETVKTAIQKCTKQMRIET